MHVQHMAPPKNWLKGYPLPTLLRLALLILHTTGNPVDTVLSYAHYNLHNSTFAAYLPVLTSRANVTRVLTASPLNMGLLTPSPPPWHPAPAALRDTVNQVMESDIVKSWPGGLPNLALGFSLRGGALDPMVPNVIGLSSPKEVHEAVAVWREVTSQGDSQAQKRKDAEVAVRNQFASAGWADASWTGRG
ncbi:hypothetical protein FRB99_001114 [Tulasnella sp. 403]|nr:hypothetical protein FRB99_001114 [Tulasnella sp. 403]